MTAADRAMVPLVLNGADVEVQGPDDMPLLWALRDLLGMTGTKFGCGRGLCGACTVHVDGIAVRSCVTPLSALRGRRVTTIEGISGTSAGLALQSAWLAIDVPQCGYCQSGQIMSAAALLARNAQPGDEDIDRAMAGNICRCGTYARIRRGIHLAADSLAKTRPT